MKIVHVANFYGPKSGGLRTTIHQLGSEYQNLGHEFFYVVPDSVNSREVTPYGTKISIASPLIPGSGGYRVILRARAAKVILRELQPDRLEVSDRLTLRRLGTWAKRHGIFSLVISHETLDGLARRFLPTWLPISHIVNWHNKRLARAFDVVLATTEFAAAEFRRIEVQNLHVVPLGTDLDTFSPTHFDERLRELMARQSAVVLLHCGRLSPEKSPRMSIDTLEELMRRGYDARLVVVGDGPMRESMQQHAAGLPVDFLGFISDRGKLANIIASSDVALAPGPLETFCLAALEALASGTQVVCSESSAVREVVGIAGRPARNSARDFADAVEAVLSSGPRRTRQQIARIQAEQFTWQRTAHSLLEIQFGDLPRIATHEAVAA